MAKQDHTNIPTTHKRYLLFQNLKIHIHVTVSSQIKNAKVDCNVGSYTNERRYKSLIERSKSFLFYHSYNNLKVDQHPTLEKRTIWLKSTVTSILHLTLFDAQDQLPFAISGHLMGTSPENSLSINVWTICKQGVWI